MCLRTEARIARAASCICVGAIRRPQRLIGLQRELRVDHDRSRRVWQVDQAIRTPAVGERRLQRIAVPRAAPLRRCRSAGFPRTRRGSACSTGCPAATAHRPTGASIFSCALSMVASRSCSSRERLVVVLTAEPCRFSAIRSCISFSVRAERRALSCSRSFICCCTCASRASMVWDQTVSGRWSGHPTRVSARPTAGPVPAQAPAPPDRGPSSGPPCWSSATRADRPARRRSPARAALNRQRPPPASAVRR